MIFYNAGGIESQFLQAVLDVKKIDYKTEIVNSGCGIGDKDLLLLDIFTAVKYLDERYPVPKLFSHNPEQNARLNMFVRDVMRKGYDNNDLTIFTELEKRQHNTNYI